MSEDAELDHLFRHAAGQMVSALTRVLGAHRVDLAEEVVQDAMVKALEQWRFHGVPANPRGWLYRVARNRAMDLLRRDATLAAKLEQLPADLDVNSDEQGSDPFADDELAMIFLCCHPSLSLDARTALTLKLVGGFSVEEIAAAFLAEPATIAQRIVRAKRTLATVADLVELPDPTETGARLDSVLDALYLLFNEGYDAHTGDVLVRAELCGEAIRLMRLLVSEPRTGLPHAHALLALMLFQAARLPARESDDGELVLLRDQDHSRWDRTLIHEAVHHLDRSAAGERLTSWHVQAAIAAEHALAPAYDATNWRRVLALYDQLYAQEPTPVVALNRAIAMAHVHGAPAAMDAALPLLEQPAMRRYALLPATLAYFAEMLGDAAQAATHYRAALRLPCNAAEKRFLERRLASLEVEAARASL